MGSDVDIGHDKPLAVRSVAAPALVARSQGTRPRKETDMSTPVQLDVDVLREAIREEYAEVASCPLKGFHFHTGRFLAARLGYPQATVDALPDSVVESFAGVGNPFSWGELSPGETVLDLGSGAGFDSVLAAQMVGSRG